MRLLSICSAIFGGVAALAPLAVAQIKITPTDDLFILACENIGMDPKEICKKHFSFWLDGSKAVIADPISENTRNKLNDMYSINAKEFIAYINRRLLNRGALAFSLKEMRVMVSDAGVTAQQRPVFILQVQGTSEVHGQMEIEKSATGPAYNSFRVWNASKNPTSIRSANIAYFAAFLRVILSLEFQLGAEQKGSAGD